MSTNTIPIDLGWRGADDATHLQWISDYRQAEMEGPRLDPSASVEAQAEAFGVELLDQGHDGTGQIIMTIRR